MPNFEIRRAVDEDAAAINDVYNHYVLHSTATYQEQPESLDDRRAWLAWHGMLHPVLVATLEAKVIGWAAASPFHGRSAFRHTVESAVYIRPDHHRRGIGRSLMHALLLAVKAANHRTVIAAIESTQQPSVAMHSALGFVETGRLHAVGFKFGQWLDLVYLQKML